MAMYSDLITQTYTDARYPLGTLRWTEGPEIMPTGLSTNRQRLWRFVLNGEVANPFVVGTLVSRELLAADEGTGNIAPTGCGTALLLGVAQHTITFGTYGWILVVGEGLVLADTGDIATDLGILPGNAVAGRADQAAATTSYCCGRANALILATNTGSAHISCPL